MIHNWGKKPHRLLSSNLFGLFSERAFSHLDLYDMQERAHRHQKLLFHEERRDFLEWTHLIFQL